LIHLQPYVNDPYLQRWNKKWSIKSARIKKIECRIEKILFFPALRRKNIIFWWVQETLRCRLTPILIPLLSIWISNMWFFTQRDFLPLYQKTFTILWQILSNSNITKAKGRDPDLLLCSIMQRSTCTVESLWNMYRFESWEDPSLRATLHNTGQQRIWIQGKGSWGPCRPLCFRKYC
jgi:hypothetical protein